MSRVGTHLCVYIHKESCEMGCTKVGVVLRKYKFLMMMATAVKFIEFYVPLR